MLSTTSCTVVLSTTSCAVLSSTSCTVVLSTTACAVLSTTSCTVVLNTVSCNLLSTASCTVLITTSYTIVLSTTSCAVCCAGLGRTGVLIACYLVYALRVHANDAIRYVRHKRPNSVQTSGQIELVQEFEQYILPELYVFCNK